MVEMFLIVLENQAFLIRAAPQMTKLVEGGYRIVERADGGVVTDNPL